MRKQKILVTGGSGFIGTNLIERLIEDGYEVLNVDLKCPKILERLCVWKEIDIRNRDELVDAFLEFSPDYVIHLAARTDLNGASIEDYDSNTTGVENVIHACSCCSFIKKIIITSSMLVCKSGYIPKNYYDYKPSTLYGESKVITEKTVWSNAPSCDWAIIRPTSIWGPWFDEPYRRFFEMLLHHKYFHIGKKSATKTYGYVENAVFQIERILLSDTSSEGNKVFYIGDYEPYPIDVWANEIAEQLGYRIKHLPFFLVRCAAIIGDLIGIMGFSFPMTSFRLKNMITDNIVDIGNTELIAGDLPFTRISGIKRTLKWLRDNKQL